MEVIEPYLFVQTCISFLPRSLTDAWLAQLVRRQSAVREVSGSIPGRTNTQGLKIIEEKVLPLL